MNTDSLITAQNWTYTGYETANMLAFIHLGAKPSGTEASLLYLVTVLRELEEEIFQLEFDSLDQAIDAINKRYSHWEFKDRGERSDGGGCGTCAAH